MRKCEHISENHYIRTHTVSLPQKNKKRMESYTDILRTGQAFIPKIFGSCVLLVSLNVFLFDFCKLGYNAIANAKRKE